MSYDNSPALDFPEHTVEKIGGTTMAKIDQLCDTLFVGDRRGADLYGRIFVVSAFGGITDLLLEHKKSGEPGVFAHFANSRTDHGWLDALSRVSEAMCAAHRAVLADPADIADADQFVRDRIEGARSCLFDLQRLCSYGHFSLSQQMQSVRELLSGLGEAHSAFTTVQLLKRLGVNARLIDLSGWRDEGECTLDERIATAFGTADVTTELLIATGYAHCTEGLLQRFDRGYSEVTFSRIAAMTGAREAIIHKEFHLSSADPRIVGADVVRKLGRTNYDVADQLSNMGMEAIHPRAAKTLRQAEVPLRVTNAFDPGDPGTLIDDRPSEGPARVEIVSGLNVIALELFEQDMVGVKGYDANILEALKRHDIQIVSKTSNANTITHYLEASLKDVRRVEQELAQMYPASSISVRSLAIASVIGRDLTGLRVLTDSLVALDAKGIEVVAAHQTPRNVDVQLVLNRGDLEDAIRALHKTLIEDRGSDLAKAA